MRLFVFGVCFVVGLFVLVCISCFCELIWLCCVCCNAASCLWFSRVVFNSVAVSFVCFICALCYDWSVIVKVSLLFLWIIGADCCLVFG